MASNKWFTFKYGEVAPVFEEALANKCKVVVIKNHGLALISQKGEMNENNERSKIAFAEGFNPAKDDEWYDELGDILGYDDFLHILEDLGVEQFNEILGFKRDIRIQFTSNQIILEY